MNERDVAITAGKINNIHRAIVEILNNDIDGTPDGQFDPFDHVTALSMILCEAAHNLKMPREMLLSGMGQCFDTMGERDREQEEIVSNEKPN